MIDGTSVFIWWNLWTRELKHDLNSFEFKGDEKRSRRGQKRLRRGWEELEKRSRSGHKRSRRGWEEVALGRAWEEVGKRLGRGWEEVGKRLRRLTRGWEELRRAAKSGSSRVEKWPGKVRMKSKKIWEDLSLLSSSYKQTCPSHLWEESENRSRRNERGWEGVRGGETRVVSSNRCWVDPHCCCWTPGSRRLTLTLKVTLYLLFAH